jgi:hypothetical protein
MLTLFTTPKPFEGHEAIIQRNAITSWTLLRPKPEVIVFGDERGAGELCAELNVRHIPEIARSEQGTPLLNALFSAAEEAARHDLLGWVNADIILMGDFIQAVQRTAEWGRGSGSPFLMAGGRWDLDVTEPLDFGEDWERSLRGIVDRNGASRGLTGIDYFVFPRSSFSDLAPLAIGRSWLDRWLIWRARSMGVPVIDSTSAVLAVHQLHGYAHLSARTSEEVSSRRPANVEVGRNLAVSRGRRMTLEDATHVIGAGGVRRVRLRPIVLRSRRAFRTLWFAALDVTRPVRRALGLRRKASGANASQLHREESVKHGLE